MIGISIGKTGHVLVIVLSIVLLDGIVSEYRRTRLLQRFFRSDIKGWETGQLGPERTDLFV